MEPIAIALAALLATGLLGSALLLGRNRAFTGDAPVFRASRWTRGNHLWPTQVGVFAQRVVRYTPRLFGHFEETIGIDQVASVSVDSHMVFGDVIIETTGGSQPIRCHGHWKGDAAEIRHLISQAQGRPAVLPARRIPA